MILLVTPIVDVVVMHLPSWIQPLIARWIMFYLAAYLGLSTVLALRAFCHSFSGSKLLMVDSGSRSNCVDDMLSKPTT